MEVAETVSWDLAIFWFGKGKTAKLTMTKNAPCSILDLFFVPQEFLCHCSLFSGNLTNYLHT